VPPVFSFSYNTCGLSINMARLCAGSLLFLSLNSLKNVGVCSPAHQFPSSLKICSWSLSLSLSHPHTHFFLLFFLHYYFFEDLFLSPCFIKILFHLISLTSFLSWEILLFLLWWLVIIISLFFLLLLAMCFLDYLQKKKKSFFFHLLTFRS